MTIEDYFGDWHRVIDLSEADRILKKVSKENICPRPKDVYKAFHLCPLKDLRLCIIGQDPYPTLRKGNPVATGVAFANSPDTPEDSLSSSLEVLKESIINFEIPHGIINFDNSLEKWEEQGVLLINSALSCQVGRPGSHMLTWRPFMESFLINLSKCTGGIVYLLMGNSAISLENCINRQNNHIVRCKHPSYYARNHEKMPYDIWKEVNDILIGMNGYGINWFEEY